MNKLEDSRRERKKRESKAKILKVARSFFKTKGFDETSVEDICKEADIAKGTFFNYFPSKESILESIGEEEADDLQYFVDVDLADEMSPCEKIYKVMKFFLLDTISFEGLIGRIIMYNTSSKNVKFCALDRMRITIENLVVEAQEAGEILKELDSYDVSMSIMGLYFSLMLNSVTGTEDKTGAISEEHFDKLVPILFKGISAK